MVAAGSGASWWRTWAPVMAAIVVVFGAIYAVVAKLDAVQAQHSADCQTFAKIETQMGTVETIINQDHVREKADIGALKEKVFGESPAPYYYEIKIPHEIQPC